MWFSWEVWVFCISMLIGWASAEIPDFRPWARVNLEYQKSLVRSLGSFELGLSLRLLSAFWLRCNPPKSVPARLRTWVQVLHNPYHQYLPPTPMSEYKFCANPPITTSRPTQTVKSSALSFRLGPALSSPHTFPACLFITSPTFHATRASQRRRTRTKRFSEKP